MAVADSPSIAVSDNYDSYRESVERFNQNIHVTLSDIYSRMNLLTKAIEELDKRQVKMVDPEYVNKLEARINKVTGDLGSTISAFNSSVEKINGNYKDSFDKINKLNSAVEGLSNSMNKMSVSLGESITSFNKATDRINDKARADTESINRLNETIKKLSERLSTTVSNLSSTDNELAEKVTKLSDTLYSGLPQINDVIDEVNEIKKNESTMSTKLGDITNATNSLTVQTNGLQLKLDTLGREFENVQKGVSDTQKHVMDFINIARSTTTNLSAYNPDAVNMEIKKTEDRMDNMEKEIGRVLENYNALDKNLSGLSGKISDLYVVKNATKLFDNMQSTVKTIEDTGNKMNAQSSKIEVMFNEISSYMNRFIDLNNKLNEMNKRLIEMEGEVGKIKGAMSLFATKDDLIDVHNKVERLSLGSG